MQSMYYKKLVHMIMEAEKSHNLLSSSWRTGKDSHVAELESEYLRIRRQIL